MLSAPTQVGLCCQLLAQVRAQFVQELAMLPLGADSQIIMLPVILRTCYPVQVLQITLGNCHPRAEGGTMTAITVTYTQFTCRTT